MACFSGGAGSKDLRDRALLTDRIAPGSDTEMPALQMSSHSARGDRPDMLDAFIIDRIRRERESRERQQQRPQLDMPRPQRRPALYERPPEEDERDRTPDRGVVIIDFTI